ncbi:hypothetical protein AVEN_93501-1 [Araneus ventricosus]|uniref:Lysozyme inhibitor LprI N-terminal domain-containing protein n=1 Tax=Araneus ventricosus TaxID=182803 RepID=A0A4Y2APP0_ARAVE|nr:hypothetical protein AVEN_93501-1 [Araneus ventricosus]
MQRDEVDTEIATARTQLQRDWNACTSQTQRDCFTVRSAQLYNAARDQFRSYGCRRQESSSTASTGGVKAVAEGSTDGGCVWFFT